MDQIKDTLQTIREHAELNNDLLTLDLLKESADIICGAVTFGLTTFIARALKVLRMAVKEENLKMQLQDQLRDKWGANAPDLDAYI